MPPRRPISKIIPSDNDWERENRNREAREAFGDMVNERVKNPPAWVKHGFDVVAFALVVAVCAGIGAVVVALLVKFAMWLL